MKLQYLVQLVDNTDKSMKLLWMKDLSDLQTFLQHVDDDTYTVGDITATEIIPDWKDYIKQEPKLETGGITND